MNTRLEYEVFSTYYENASYNYRQTNFESDEEFLDFLKKIQFKSLYDYGVELTSQDRILTLSTCNNRITSDTRSVTHARLVRQIAFDIKSGTESEGDNSDKGGKKAVLANVYLMDLKLCYGPSDKLTYAVIDPSFNTVFREFTTELPADVLEVSLLVTPADTQSKLTYTLNGKEADPALLKLLPEDNEIKLHVQSRDGQYDRNYTIFIKRSTPAEAGQPSPTSLQSTPEAK